MDYCGDTHPDGNYFRLGLSDSLLDLTSQRVALAFTTEFCCDNHNDGFDLNKYFPGPILTSSPPKPAPEKKKRSKYRPMNQRTELAAQIMTWWRIAHSDDPIFRSWAQDWILPDSSIILLARANSGDFATPNDITKFLQENNDWHDSWANEIHTIIHDYDILINTNKRQRRPRTAPAN